MTLNFSCQFNLNKAYYLECYEQSVKAKTGFQAYRNAVFLLVLGFTMSLLSQQYYALSLFVIVLAVLEATSVYFAKIWWVWRQLLSKAANSEVMLNFDEQGLTTTSRIQSTSLAWSEVNKINETDAGFILVTDKGRSYLTKSCLSEPAIEFIRTLGVVSLV